METELGSSFDLGLFGTCNRVPLCRADAGEGLRAQICEEGGFGGSAAADVVQLVVALFLINP